MSQEMELEIKFQNETTTDLERQIIQIVRKYADLKCKNENIKKEKKSQKETARNVFHKNENEYIERLDDDQLMNILGIPKSSLSKCY